MSRFLFFGDITNLVELEPRLPAGRQVLSQFLLLKAKIPPTLYPNPHYPHGLKPVANDIRPRWSLEYFLFQLPTHFVVEFFLEPACRRAGLELEIWNFIASWACPEDFLLTKFHLPEIPFTIKPHLAQELNYWL